MRKVRAEDTADFVYRQWLQISRFDPLTESLLLALIGAGLGVVLAYRALRFIVARLPEYSFPHEADFHVNLPMLLFSVSLAVFTGVLFGVFPALESARREINHVIQAGTHKMAGSVRGKRMHTGLIAGQIALTLLLLTAAGAAIQGFSRMMRRPLGYDPHHVMSVGIPVHENTLNTWAERAAYFTQLRERVTATPGVISAGISTNATPPSNGWGQPFEILGKTAAEQQEARANFVSPEYFTILHIPLVEGRLWEQSEVSRGATLALVNQAFVRRYFPGEDVLNHSVRMPRLISQPPSLLTATGSDGWVQIIGVAGDALDRRFVLATERREVDGRQFVGIGPAAQSGRRQSCGGDIHGLVPTILGKRTNCHPERSEGPLGPRERSLAALGMTTGCYVDSASMSS
jgi:hypothetical protein